MCGADLESEESSIKLHHKLFVNSLHGLQRRDSFDWKVLFNILAVSGVDVRTKEIIEQTLTETYSKVKFMGEL